MEGLIVPVYEEQEIESVHEDDILFHGDVGVSGLVLLEKSVHLACAKRVVVNAPGVDELEEHVEACRCNVEPRIAENFCVRPACPLTAGELAQVGEVLDARELLLAIFPNNEQTVTE